MNIHQAKQLFLLLLTFLFLLGTGTVQAQKVRVTEAVPFESEEDVTYLAVEISGGGFDEESEATFFVAGSLTNKGGVTIKSTVLINSKKVRAIINIPLGASLGDYDIEVTASRGRRGKGNTLFRVLEKGTGGGNANDLGSNISMDCLLGDSSSGDTIKTIKKDGGDEPGWYEDAVDKVDCTIDGPAMPWPIHLGVGGGKGKWANVRQVDINLGGFDMGTYNHPYGLEAVQGTDLLSALYPNLFDSEMDPLRLNVRPYRKDPTQTEGSIHLLTPGGLYEMGMRFKVPASTGSERFAVSIASKWYEGNELFTGIACESGDEANILINSPEEAGSPNLDGSNVKGHMRDVLVYLWPDDDGDGYADAYTVTTGLIVVDENTGFPTVTPGPRYAAVCSAAGPKVCGNPKAPSNCNFLGYVEIQFTLDTVVN